MKICFVVTQINVLDEIKSVQSCRTSQQYWKYCGSQDPLTELDFKMVLSIGFGLDFDLDNSEG